jgi:hypothetical protein
MTHGVLLLAVGMVLFVDGATVDAAAALPPCELPPPLLHPARRPTIPEIPRTNAALTIVSSPCPTL